MQGAATQKGVFAISGEKDHLDDFDEPPLGHTGDGPSRRRAQLMACPELTFWLPSQGL
jgi:hypothetical protein